MKKNILLFLIKYFTIFLFFIFIFSKTYIAASKSIEDKILNKNINLRESELHRFNNKEEEIKYLSTKKAEKQSFEDLQENKIIPDVIISIDSTKIKTEDFDKLLNKLFVFKNEGKKIDYYTSNNLVGIYFYLYNVKNLIKSLKEEFKEIKEIKISENRKIKKSYIPNDTFYSSQWNLQNIKWPEAINLSTGNNQVIIGIIDNGVDPDDYDLSSNIWQNSSEIYNDIKDNDNNGYIDDKYGCNFYMKWNQGFNYISCLKEYIKEDLILNEKHGTYVAQVAAASTNNNLGIVGICPNCKIAVLKITYYDGSGDFSLIPFVFNYAIDKGLKILNLSMSSVCPFDSSEDVFASDINNLINNHNILLVQSAGNQGSLTQSQCINQCGSSNPYCYSTARNQAYYYVEGKNIPNKINVASINFSNQRSSFSNYDSGYSVITVAAPGENIPVYPYNLVSGTSFSAPMVSGALGLYLTNNLNFTSSSWSLKYLLNNLGDNISTDYYISNKKLNLENMMNIRRRFIEKLYLKVLERNYDDTGLNAWLNYFNSTLNKYSIINGFVNSDEYLNKYLTNVYQKILKRNPDTSGLNGWKNYLKNNGDYDSLFYYFSTSSEYKNKYPTNELYVENLYKDLLDRNYDNDGYYYWIDQLNRNLKTKDQVAYGFVFSYESNYKFIRSLYTKYLERTSSDGENNLWINASDLNRISILKNILNSEEFFVKGN